MRKLCLVLYVIHLKKKEVNGYFVQTKKDCRLTKVGKICYMRKNENNTWMYNWLSFSFFSLKRP